MSEVRGCTECLVDHAFSIKAHPQGGIQFLVMTSWREIRTEDYSHERLKDWRRWSSPPNDQKPRQGDQSVGNIAHAYETSGFALASAENSKYLPAFEALWERSLLYEPEEERKILSKAFATR